MVRVRVTNPNPNPSPSPSPRPSPNPKQAMHQWRSQWGEELTEKNSIDAELLTLRSEFEKSSATYDREIEGLKDSLENLTLTLTLNLTLTQP